MKEQIQYKNFIWYEFHLTLLLNEEKFPQQAPPQVQHRTSTGSSCDPHIMLHISRLEVPLIVVVIV